MNVGSIQPSVLPTNTGTPATGSFGMGGDQFMQLLLAEMKNQNPLDPVQDKDFMAQITQINSLMAMDKVSTNMQTLTLSNQMIQAANLIGKSVSYAASDGTTHSGVVTGVTYEGSQINLSLGDARVSLGQLLGVQQNAGVQQAANG